MTKKDKIKAYRKAAKLIREGKAYNCDEAIASVIGGYWWNDKTIIMFFKDAGCWFYIFNNKQKQELRNIILLSCAELIRLDFEIEQ